MLVIDRSDPAMQEALADCEVGVPKTLTVDVTPIAVEGVLVAKVDAVSYAEPTAAPEVEEEAPAAPKAYKPKASKAAEPME